MAKRSHIRPTDSLEVRLSEEVRRLQKQADGMPPGVARDAVTRRARQAETGLQMNEWLRSPGGQPPK